ncbi:hypothetical protein ISS08_02365 [Candidatus Pacearchaeota archaeon]|nr:hypothetical protein [Candidatus Pacearchaeota archaeon]
MKMNFKNKKGMLLAEETLKIIIALIGIVFLVYLLYSLYLNSGGDKDLEFAQDSLDYFVEQIQLEEIENIEIFNPSGWYVHIWPHTAYIWTWFPGNVFVEGFLKRSLVETSPFSCENMGWESCICICEKNNPDNCAKNGFCVENKYGFILENGSKQIKSPPIIFELNRDTKEIK